MRSFLTLQKRSKMLQMPNPKKSFSSINVLNDQEPEMLRYLIEIELPECKVVYQG